MLIAKDFTQDMRMDMTKKPFDTTPRGRNILRGRVSEGTCTLRRKEGLARRLPGSGKDLPSSPWPVCLLLLPALSWDPHCLIGAAGLEPTLATLLLPFPTPLGWGLLTGPWKTWEQAEATGSAGT